MFYIVEMKGLDCRLVLVVVLALRESRCDDDTTLTTAVTLNETTPKPTTIHHRIPVDPHVHNIERAPLDLFRLTARELRRTQSVVWNWDYWCHLQPKTGTGNKKLDRYYYDAQIDQCLSFTFLGSKGNRNNFNTLSDCERYCKGAAYMSIKDSLDSSFCSLQPHAGFCMGMFDKYFYDVNEKRCKNFIFGGCGGNQNRFGTVRECISRCNPNHHKITDPY